MKFEFDPDKSLTNKVKHGIDFDEAQELWKDGKLLIAPTRSVEELRSMAIGLIAGKFWTAVFTRRGDAVRLISVRRSRPEEVEKYEGPRKDH